MTVRNWTVLLMLADYSPQQQAVFLIKVVGFPDEEVGHHFVDCGLVVFHFFDLILYVFLLDDFELKFESEYVAHPAKA